jgi:transposase-like protein
MPHVRNAVAAQLTDGIPLKEACSITGLSRSQLDRGRQTLKNFHLSQFLSSVSYKLLFFIEIFTTNHILLLEKN